MGSVHLGRVVGASGFSRVVAIKRLFPGFATDASFRQMLVDEARFASRIRQPNVVPILDVVEADRDLYVVMEYVHGLPLADALALSTKAPMPVGIATAIAEAVLFGLHAAHEARDEDGTPLGIVHRDVSPQNVLVGADGVPRLIDFGIAKAATRMQATDPGVLKGKAGYMAPEQFLHEAVGRTADVFSASVVLWEMLAGRRLFPRSTPIAEQRAPRRGSRPVPPSRYGTVEGIDPALDALVLRGLARDPARRFPTAEAMARELRSDRTIASAVDVARWLVDVAGDELEISEERVRMFEQSPSGGAADAAPAGPGVTAPATVSTIPEAWLHRCLSSAVARGRMAYLRSTAVRSPAIAAGVALFKLRPPRPCGPSRVAAASEIVTAAPPLPTAHAPIAAPVSPRRPARRAPRLSPASALERRSVEARAAAAAQGVEVEMRPALHARRGRLQALRSALLLSARSGAFGRGRGRVDTRRGDSRECDSAARFTVSAGSAVLSRPRAFASFPRTPSPPTRRPSHAASPSLGRGRRDGA